MPTAAEQVRRILLESAKRYGTDAAGRYDRLLFAAFEAVGERPDRLGATNLPSHPEIRAYHARLARSRVGAERRVGSPRHVVLYRIAPDGIVDSLAVIHDRMLLSRAAGSALRAVRP